MRSTFASLRFFNYRLWFAGALVATHGTAVLEITQGRQRGLHDLVGGVAVEGGDNRQAARVLLVRTAVETLVLGLGGESPERRFRGG